MGAGFDQRKGNREELRIFQGEPPPARAASLSVLRMRPSGGNPGSGSGLVDHRLIHIGTLIEDSLTSLSRKGFSTLRVTIPKGVSDIEALDALNTVARRKLGCEFIDPKNRRKFEAVASWSEPNLERRDYSVILLVDGTENRDYHQSVKRLTSCELTPADPLPTAIVLLASTIRGKGECFVADYTMRTSDADVSLSFVKMRQKLIVRDERLSPDPQTMMAAIPVTPKAEPRFLERFLGLFSRS